MKSLENCNIAVCFVGQSRTFEHCADSINAFFSSNRGNKYHYFGHTWDTNSYKVRNGDTIEYRLEQVDDIIALESKLRNTFDFKSLIVEKEIHRQVPWASVFYSTMRSNFLKQQYEAENNMMFDMVIKARLDVCYRPGTTFENSFKHSIKEKTLFANYGLMNYEFVLPNPDDVIYYGSSLTMDLVDSIYNALCTGAFQKLVKTSHDNPAYTMVGPGALIHKWMTMKNIMPEYNLIDHAVFRKETLGIDPITNWNKVVDVAGLVY